MSKSDSTIRDVARILVISKSAVLRPLYRAHWHAWTYGLYAVNNLATKLYIPTYEGLTTTLDRGETIVFNHRVLLKLREFF